MSMTTIRSAYPVPIPTSRRVEPASRARGSNDRPASQERALVTVPTPQSSERDAPRNFVRARPATSEVMIQVIAGQPRRGIKADASEIDRYRRTYEKAAQPAAVQAPQWERRA